MVPRIPAWPTLAFAALLLAAPARADQTTQTVTGGWKTADQCAKDAFRKYPDYTAAAKAKRAAMQQECLRNHNLPSDPAGAGSGQ